MQRVVVLAAVAAVRLRRAGVRSDPTLGSADPSAAELAAQPPGGPVRGPPDLEQQLEVVSPDVGLIAQALDNWTATAEHLVRGFAAATGANETRFTIVSEMDVDAPLPPANLAAQVTPTTAPVVPCTFADNTPPKCHGCRSCLQGWCKGNHCAGCEPCDACEPYFQCVEGSAAARLTDAEHATLAGHRGSHHAAVPQPMLYFFNVTISPDPSGLCPHSEGAGDSNPVDSPERCDCIDVLRAENVSQKLLAAMRAGHVADFALDGRPAGAWFGLGGKRFMKPQPPPNHTDTFLHWEGGAPVTPAEAMEFSAQTANLVSDFVTEQARHTDAAAQAMQMAGQLPCAGTVDAPKGPDGQWHPYPCVDKFQETPEVPTNMRVPRNPDVGPGAALKEKYVVN